MTGFTDLFNLEIIRFVKLVKSEDDLTVQNDHNLVVWRDYDKVIFLFVNDCDILDVFVGHILSRYPTEKGEHVKVLSQEKGSFFFQDICAWLTKPVQVFDHRFIVEEIWIIQVH